MSWLKKSKFSTNELLACLSYISDQQKIPIKLECINVGTDSIDVNTLNLYSHLIGVTFLPVNLTTNLVISKMVYPVIIEINKDSYRVLIKNSKKKTVVFNPLTYQEEVYDRKLFYKQITKAWQCCLTQFHLSSGLYYQFKSIFSYFRKEIFVSLLYGVATALGLLLMSYFSGYIFSHIHEVDGSNFVISCIIFFIFITCSSVLNYAGEMYNKSLNMKVVIYTLPSILNYILNLPIPQSQSISSAELVHKLIDYESSLSSIVGSGLLLLYNFISIIVLLISMLYSSVLLAGLYLFVFLIIVIIKLTTISSNVRHINAYLFEQGKILSFLNEMLMQIHKVRSSNVETVLHKKWLYGLISSKTQLAKSVNLEVRVWIVESIGPILLLLSFYGYYYFSKGSMNTYHLLKYMIISGQLLIIFDKLSNDIVAFIHLLPALQRLNKLFHIKSQSYNLINHHIKYRGEISMINVSLRHSKIDSYILKNISIDIKAGSFVAIVGASGAGKSSIFRLLLGFEPIYSGTITVDKKDIKNINTDAMRNQFGVVLQSSSLFPGTIFSNIAVNNNIMLDDAWRLAKYVGLDNDVNAMPMKMYTYISDSPGDSVSGGQRQKILLARALASNPKILFLDEATSALDSKSQSVIFDSLKRMNITRIVIAHRHSTIVDADKIYMLDKGKITDVGSFGELSSRGHF